MSLGEWLSRVGDSFANAPPQAWFSLAQALSSSPNVGQGLAQGLAGFGEEAQGYHRKQRLADALRGIGANLSPEQRGAFDALAQEMPGQVASGYIGSLFDKKEQSSGPFEGKGFDASAANILVRGTMNPALRSTPEYAIAYANMTSPRVVTDAEGRQMIYTPPAPRGIAPPDVQGGAPHFAPPTSAPPPQARPPVAPSMPAPRPQTSVPAPGVKGDSATTFYDPDNHPELYGGAQVNPPVVAGAPPQAAATPTPNGGSITTIPGTGKAPIETQIKNQSFYIRQSAAEQTLSDPGALEKFLDPSNAIPREIGMGFLQSGPAQAVDQAGDEWVNSLLRPDSGAAIPPEEMSRYRATYVPEWGDKPEKLAQKKAARVRAAQGIKAGLTPEQVVEAEGIIARNPNPVLKQAAPKAPPKFGAIVEKDGKRYRFLGGDPANPKQWTPLP